MANCCLAGAVGISFWLYDYSFCFISSHLAAHIEKVGKRNADYKEIISQMKLGNKDIDINNQFHYMFWLGDLNYRLEAPRETVLDLIKSTDLERLLGKFSQVLFIDPYWLAIHY